MMSFETDVMISYSWRDNEPPPMTKSAGWVSGFQEGLEYWLKQVMPRPPKVWRDKHQMPGNKVFAEELEDTLSTSAILVTVLSEPYLASEWCLRELETFTEAAEEQGGLQIANDYRIFKINKLPVDRTLLPPKLTVVTGFDFYEMDDETRVFAPIDPSFGESDKQRFIRKVYDVAVALAKLLKQIETSHLDPLAAKDDDDEPSMERKPANHGSTSLAQALPMGMTVFIPHVTRDLREVRDDLVAELSRRNCKTLPEEQAVYDDSEKFKADTLAQLQQADVAVHLIGSRYGNIMEGESKSVVELQNEWAAEESKKRGLKRLIWIPKTLGEVTGQQATLIGKLRSDREAIVGADLLEDSVENLKSIVLEMIKPKVKANVEDSEHGERKLYLMHDEGDKDAVREIRKALKDVTVHGCPLKLLLPVFDGDAASLREIQRQRIQECDAVMLFWGGSSQAWVEAGLGEVRKSPAYGRKEPFGTKHLVYISGTKTSAKEDWILDAQDGLLEEDVETIDATGGDATSPLTQFIQTIK